MTRRRSARGRRLTQVKKGIQVKTINIVSKRAVLVLGILAASCALVACGSSSSSGSTTTTDGQFGNVGFVLERWLRRAAREARHVPEAARRDAPQPSARCRGCRSGGGGGFFGGGGGGGAGGANPGGPNAGAGGRGGFFRNNPKAAAAFKACGGGLRWRPVPARSRRPLQDLAHRDQQLRRVRSQARLQPARPELLGQGSVFPSNIRNNPKSEAAIRACASLLRPPGAPGGSTGTSTTSTS